jgi:hypothetical protein
MTVFKRSATALALAFAGVVSLQSPAQADSGMLSDVQTQGNVSFVSGGVGLDESVAFKQAAADYPLELMFVMASSPRNEYLSDVKVTVRDRSRGVVLDTVTKGPFLLARLPSGNYQIDATYGDVTKHQSISVRSGSHQRATFVWNKRDDATNTEVGQAAD